MLYKHILFYSVAHQKYHRVFPYLTTHKFGSWGAYPLVPLLHHLIVFSLSRFTHTDHSIARAPSKKMRGRPRSSTLPCPPAAPQICSLLSSTCCWSWKADLTDHSQLADSLTLSLSLGSVRADRKNITGEAGPDICTPSCRGTALIFYSCLRGFCILVPSLGAITLLPCSSRPWGICQDSVESRSHSELPSSLGLFFI